eukprot:39819_1
MGLSWLFVTVFIYCLTPTVSQCDNAYQCVGQQIQLSNQVNIFGYKGASGSTTSITVDMDPNVNALECHGAFSCEFAAFIHLSNGHIDCKATYSCANTSITMSVDNIDCFGVQSCSFSNITSIDDSQSRCDGQQSCSYTSFTAVEVVRGTSP